MQAIVRSTAIAAVKGNVRAQQTFTKLQISIEEENRASFNVYLQAMIEYKCECDAEIDRRRRLNLTGPEPLPHPDHIVIDPRTGDVRIDGPMTKEDKVKWDGLRAKKSDFLEEHQGPSKRSRERAR